MRCLFCLLFALVALTAAPASSDDEQTGRRLALIIANGDYPVDVGSLGEQPRLDAEVMSEALEAARFETTLVFDADRNAVWDAVEAFSDALRAEEPGVVGFFYYAGHGATAGEGDDRQNYLLPAHTSIIDARQLTRRNEGVALDDVVDELHSALGEEAESALFVVLDACRNDLLPAFSRSAGGRGFAPMPTYPGLFLSYSTPQGGVAPNDGVFATALAAQIREPGQFAGRAFELAARSVARDREYESGLLPVLAPALSRDVCFISCPVGETEQVRRLVDEALIIEAAERGRSAQFELERGDETLALLLAYDGLAPLFDPDDALPLGDIARPTPDTLQRVEHGLAAMAAAASRQAYGTPLLEPGRERQRANAAAYSPDGQRIAVARGRSVALHNADDGAFLTAFDAPGGSVSALAWRADGQALAAAGESGVVHVLDSGDGAVIQTLPAHGEGVDALAFSADGRQLATGADDGSARLWDVETAALTFEASLREEGYARPVTEVWFGADDAHLIAYARDGDAVIWRTDTGERRLTVGASNVTHRMGAVTVSADGAWLATGDAWGEVVVWSVATAESVAEFRLERQDDARDPRDSIVAIAFDPAAERVAVGGHSGGIAIWDIASGATVARPARHPPRSNRFAFSPDGAVLATASIDSSVTTPASVRLWNVENGALITELALGSRWFTALGFAPDGDRLLIADAQSAPTLWELGQYSRLVTVDGSALSPHQSVSLSSAMFDPSGARFVVSSGEAASAVFDVASGRRRFVLDYGPPEMNAGGVHSIFGPDGIMIATASRTGDVAYIADAETGAEIARFTGHDDHVRRIAVSPDGQRAATASDDETAWVWDTATGAEIARLEGHRLSVRSVAFSPDGSRVITGSGDGAARVFDASTGAVQFLIGLPGSPANMVHAEFSPDGARIATAAGSYAGLWDAATGDSVALFHEPDDRSSYLNWVSFSRDGARVVTASADHTARVWDSETGDLLMTLDGHEDRVIDARFSPDGEHVVTASADHTARVWDWRSGAQIAVLEGHEDWVNAASFSPDGRWVLTSSSDGAARLWRAPLGPEGLLRFVRQRLTRITPPDPAACARYGLDCEAILTQQ